MEFREQTCWFLVETKFDNEESEQFGPDDRIQTMARSDRG